MANLQPPPSYSGTPAVTTLPAGTVLFRIHAASRPADMFRTVPSHRYYGGGRFDATADDEYPFMYAGESVEVAIAETLLRDLPFDPAGVFQLPLVKIRGRRISAVSTTSSLTLVNLQSAAGLAAVSQDPWLTTCDPSYYAQSRHWAHWIRGQAPGACGYVWMSRCEPTQRAFVFFGDRMPPGAITAVSDVRLPLGDEAVLDSSQGRRALRRRLAVYNVALTRG